MKALFEPHNVTFANKETILELNGCTIEAFPSNHLDAYRALANPKFIFIDEADFFRKSEQELENQRHIFHKTKNEKRLDCNIIRTVFCFLTHDE
jgi:hypothetical protein